MSPELQEQVKRTLERLEDKFDFHVPDVPEGPENKDLRFMCHLWEPLRVIHKPLIFIILMEACTGLSALILSILGFTKYSTPTFTYWAKNVKKPIKLSVAVSFRKHVLHVLFHARWAHGNHFNDLQLLGCSRTHAKCPYAVMCAL